jgi:thioesterase domain-containing protein
MTVAEAPVLTMLTDEQIESMSDEQIQEFFERARAAAARRGLAVATSKGSGAAGVPFDSVLSRAAIFARADRAHTAATQRRTETETAYNERLAAYLTANKLEAVTPELQERIDTHVREALARAESGYAKTSKTNKTKARASNVSEQAPEAGNEGNEGGE